VAESALPAQQQILSVSQLTRYLKYLVEQDELLAGLSVQGEICESSRSTSGHYYLTIKDATSQITCVLFRREAAQQPEAVAELRKGAFVVIHGFLTLYEPRGTCQVYIQRILSQGEGIFARQFAELKAKLEREGSLRLTASVPARVPRKLALLTSPHGQAYHDVLHRLKAQYPFATVIVAGVSVQGDGAADEIILALDIVNRLTDAEVILIVRAGCSAGSGRVQQ
jgi:exodeoxyribonuclease VII large subunit